VEICNNGGSVGMVNCTFSSNQALAVRRGRRHGVDGYQYWNGYYWVTVYGVPAARWHGGNGYGAVFTILQARHNAQCYMARGSAIVQWWFARLTGTTGSATTGRVISAITAVA